MDTNNRASRPDCPSTAPAALRPPLTRSAIATRDPPRSIDSTRPQHIAHRDGRIRVQHRVPTRNHCAARHLDDPVYKQPPLAAK